MPKYAQIGQDAAELYERTQHGGGPRRLNPDFTKIKKEGIDEDDDFIC